MPLLQSIRYIGAVFLLAGWVKGGVGSYSRKLLLSSLAAIVPALLGMFIGQRVRDQIEPLAF